MGIGEVLAGPHAFPRSEAADAALSASVATDELALDLLNDFATLARALPRLIASGSWPNAFLACAGMHQIVEDRLRDPYSLSLVRRRVARVPLAGRGGAALMTAAARAVALRERVGPFDTEGLAAETGALARRLADALVDGHCDVDAELLARAASLARKTADAPAALRREIVRIPSCFRSFDLAPADVARLVHDAAARCSDRSAPLGVLGVRTSGSYLAPLAAAYFAREGFTDARSLTLRPGQPVPGPARSALRDIARSGGSIFVVDDPPNTGGSP